MAFARSGRSGFSPRRKLLLGVVVAILAAMAVLRVLGVAGFNGTPPDAMDWDGDGTVTRGEIVQGFSIVAVEVARDGARTCRSYIRLRDRGGDALRVDCRTEPGASAP